MRQTRAMKAAGVKKTVKAAVEKKMATASSTSKWRRTPSPSPLPRTTPWRPNLTSDLLAQKEEEASGGGGGERVSFSPPSSPDLTPVLSFFDLMLSS